MARPEKSIKYYCRRRPGWTDDWIYERPTRSENEFGDVTSLVNALRNRRIYQFASLRLLADLVEVMRGSQKAAPLKAKQGRAPQPPKIVKASPVVLETDWPLIQRAASSSPVLFRSLQLRDHSRFANVIADRKPGRRRRAQRHRIHRVLLCQRRGLNAPVGTLAQVLAAALARQFAEPAAAAVLDDTGLAHARLWQNEKESSAGPPVSNYSDLEASILERVARTRAGTRPLVHIVIATAGSARELPPGFQKPKGFDVTAPRRGGSSGYSAAQTTGYDRIVYLTDTQTDNAPNEWVQLLSEVVRVRIPGQGDDGGGPYFCSFVPTLVRVPPPRGRSFDTQGVDQEFDPKRQQHPPARGWRLRRDECRAPFAELASMHGLWGRGDENAMVRGRSLRTLLDDPDVQEIAHRWARAVANRQVGVALSGGGALSYRLVPIIRGIQRKHVPVDIVSGVSGGALIGAYFCLRGVEGLSQCIKLGERIGYLTLAKAFFFSGVFESLVDGDLGVEDVTSLDTRLVALATAMFEKTPPASHVVTKGTLGAAVQVSGAAPVLFSPTIKETSHGRVRFADGATSAFIPARILRDYGADLIFALNCLAGPENRNPLSDWGFVGRLIYQAPLADRLIDLWISGSYLAQRIGRETDEDAHVYFEPDDEKRPLLESFRFTNGQRIVDESAETDKVKQCINDCVDTWNQFRKP